MRSLSLLSGLALLLLVAGCAAEDAPSADEATPPTTETAAAPGGEADPTACDPERDTDVASPGACAATAIGDARIEIQYGSPGVKEREIFGGLVPYDAVWRTGANEATTFETTGDLLVDGDSLAAGRYALFTIPTPTEWTVIFNATADQWGAFEYDEGADVLRMTAAPETVGTPLERFTISFEDGTDSSAVMVLAWDDVRVPVPISAAQ